MGLYLNPPERALVLSCYEMSQIQVLDCTQPSLPMPAGRAGTATRTYKRHGTITLFAALNTLDDSVISMCQPRHRHVEWLKFLHAHQRVRLNMVERFFRQPRGSARKAQTQ